MFCLSGSVRTKKSATILKVKVKLPAVWIPALCNESLQDIESKAIEVKQRTDD